MFNFLGSETPPSSQNSFTQSSSQQARSRFNLQGSQSDCLFQETNRQNDQIWNANSQYPSCSSQNQLLYNTPPASQGTISSSNSSQTTVNSQETFIHGHYAESNRVYSYECFHQELHSYNFYDLEEQPWFWHELNQLKVHQINAGLLPDKPRALREIKNYQLRQSEKSSVIKTLRFYIEGIGAFTDTPVGLLDRKAWVNTSVSEERGVHFHDREKKYTFARKKRQAQLVRMMCQILNTVMSNKFITKRDLYYRDREFYKSQRTCDNLIEDICCFTRFSRKALHILACGKGLVYGRLVLNVDGKKEDCSTFPSGFGLPYDLDSIQEITSDAKFILVVEKDASFQHLIHSRILDKFPVIMLTGKGFPDSNTRQFLRSLVQCLAIPVFAIVDCDPYGIEIVCVYKYGSLAMAHNQEIITPQLRWLGLLPGDVLCGSKWRMPFEYLDDLNQNDRKKIEDLLKRSYVQQNIEWTRQIKLMKHIGKKTEIQQIDQIEEQFLIQKYFPMKIRLVDNHRGSTRTQKKEEISQLKNLQNIAKGGEEFQDPEKQWQEYEQELRDLNLVKRYAKLFKDYWYVGLPVAAMVSLFLFGTMYFVASLGDIKAIISFIRELGVSNMIVEKLEKSEKLGSIAIAFILYKLVTPIRYALVIYFTILSTKHLVKKGLVKPFPSKKQLKEIIHETVSKAKDKTRGL